VKRPAEGDEEDEPIEALVAGKEQALGRQRDLVPID
jgi:hypothetical protein